MFKATNSSAGSNDVGGGECIAQSPSISVSDDSILSLTWFHGQRDTGDDPSGDFFDIEYSLNDGSTFNSLVEIGDTRTQALWQNSSAAIPAGSNLLIRIRTSDGASAGDLIEGGLDFVKFAQTKAKLTIDRPSQPSSASLATRPRCQLRRTKLDTL